jgi:peptidoglycan/xylan/chitin deacetylase (PgdA/CDA1 family)
MIKKVNLVVGISGQDPHLRVLKEMLSHQGVLFEEFSAERTYPCIIQTSSKRLEGTKDPKTIVADAIMPVDKIIMLLSGKSNISLDEPEINKYELLLVDAIKKVFSDQNLPFIRKWFWPGFADYCCIITHDIDRLNIPPNNFMRETPLLVKMLTYGIYLYQSRLQKKSEFDDHIDLILELEKKHGVRSSFYFFPEYAEKERFSRIIEDMRNDVFEIGLHSNATSREELIEEINQFREHHLLQISGTRQHLLNFTVPSTWLHQETLLDYDLSFYSNEKFGYRAGLCFPYRPLNTTSILEIPTSFMDWTVLNSKMDWKKLQRELNYIIESVEHYNGCLVVNFHNEYFNKIIYPHIYKSFIRILEHIQEKYWVATAKECADWWKIRESAQIDVQFKEGNISGKSSVEIPLVIEYKDHILRLNIKDHFSVECKND